MPRYSCIKSPLVQGIDGMCRIDCSKPYLSRTNHAFLMVNVLVLVAAVEVGGGPWEEPWKAEARMKQPLKALVRLPVDVDGLASILPGSLRPPGL